MTEHDDAVARLRAADPAAGTHTDTGALRQRVEERIGGQPGGGDGGTVLPLARHRRGRFQLAAAAAALVLAGTGGFALGRTTGPTTPPAALPAPGPAESGGEGTVAEGTAPAGQDAASATYPAPTTERTVFHAEGLPGEGGSATVWGYDAAAGFSGEVVTALADAVGLAGEPQQEAGTWWVGDADSAYLTVSPDGTATVSYYDATADPRACSVEPPEQPPDDGSCAPPGPPPAPEQAVDRSQQIVAAAGLDPDDFAWEVVDAGQESQTHVEGHRLVEGRPAEAVWFFAVGASGIQSFHGALAPLTDLGAYELVSPRDAVARLNDPRFGVLGGVAVAQGGHEPTASVPLPPAPGPDGPPAAPEPGAAVAWPVEETAITAATSAVTQYTAPSGVTYLVPTYELSAEDGRTWSVLALAEGELDMAPQP